MDIHPWTKYEIARLRDEERLLRARDAVRAVERGRQDGGLGQTEPSSSFLDRVRRRHVSLRQAGARSA